MAKPKAAEHFLQRQARLHARILIAIAAGAVVWLLARNFLPVTRFLIAWTAGVWLFLALILKMMLSASVTDLKKRASVEDEGRIATLILVTSATVAAFVALGLELSEALQTKAPDQTLRVAIALAAILGSWLFVIFAFALHYAHEVYGTKENHHGLGFPNEKDPDYWDFLYFAMVLGTTFQTSDVEIRSRVLRRTAMVQGLVAFLFNTAIIALTVSVASKLLGG
jgi:uncharacterized membrane protein